MPTEAERILSAVREVAPTIAERAPEIESARTLPLDLVHKFTSIGLFRMLVARIHGGLEIEFPPTIDILAELAAADGSVGWTVMIGCETPQILCLLPRASFDQIYSSGPDVICGGTFAPQGTAAIASGGYQVSGRWGFASGCRHAQWLFANCIVTRDGKPEMSPAGGMPVTRCAVAPASNWTIHDTWHTSGMRGTGSNDISIDAEIDEEWTFDLFGGQPSVPGPLFVGSIFQASLHIGAVALGIAEGALRDVVRFAGTNKRRLYSAQSLADSQLFQYRLGHAQADTQAARAVLHERAESYWAHAQAGAIPPELRTNILQTTAWVVETSARVVDTCYTAAGGSAIYQSSPLQRRLRDIHTLTQHASTQESVFATAGAELLNRSGPFRV
jgi:indole-3-acetate monooxygenase